MAMLAAVVVLVFPEPYPVTVSRNKQSLFFTRNAIAP